MSKAHNSVRQVLMNELGLTRESIRELVGQIVEETLVKHLHSDQFQQQVVKVVEQQFRVSKWDDKATLTARFRQAFIDAVKERAALVANAQFETMFGANITKSGANS